MQATKRVTLIGLIVFAGGIVAACSQKQGSAIDDAIRKAQIEKKDLIENVGQGAPFFLQGDLNPTWNSSDEKLVKLPAFELVDQNGSKTSEKNFNDQISVVAFFFTSCTGFCPILLSGLKDVAKKFKSQSHVRFVGLSVDTETDTPAILKDYQQKHRLFPKKQWLLLTGSQQTVHQIAKNTLSTEVFKREVTGPTSIIHSEHFYVFDRQARLRGVFKGTRVDTPTKIKELVDQIDGSGPGTLRAQAR